MSEKAPVSLWWSKRWKAQIPHERLFFKHDNQVKHSFISYEKKWVWGILFQDIHISLKRKLLNPSATIHICHWISKNIFKMLNWWWWLPKHFVDTEMVTIWRYEYFVVQSFNYEKAHLDTNNHPLPKKHCQPNITEVSGFTFGSDEFNFESTFTFIWTKLDLKLVMVGSSVYILVVLRRNHPKIKICLKTIFKRLHHPKIKICLKNAYMYLHKWSWAIIQSSSSL